jgi:hypothetical protein
VCLTSRCQNANPVAREADADVVRNDYNCNGLVFVDNELSEHCQTWFATDVACRLGIRFGMVEKLCRTPHASRYGLMEVR